METTQADTLLATLTVRHLVQSDLPALEWEGEYSHFRQVYQISYERMLEGKTTMWVAETPSTGVLGQVFIQMDSERLELANGIDRAYLYSFRVKAPYRNLGIGSRIMDVVETDMLQKGFYWITLNVTKDNPRAQSLYRQRGYIIVAEEPGNWTYRDHLGILHYVHEPAWRMEKRLK